MPVVWGVVNVTPDSFSDGGHFSTTDLAIRQGLSLVDEGADVVDVGGESTRPGATRVSIDTEMNRVLPVVVGLVEAGVTVSVDTMRSEVAREAVNCGASIVNDVSGGRSDSNMHAVVADLAVPYVLMHWRGYSVDMNDKAVYRDTVREVRREIEEQIVIATAQGVDPTLIIVDPGIGFAKEAEHNWELLRSVDTLAGAGAPILVGASRKRFLGSLLAGRDGALREVDARDTATAALSALLAFRGIWGLRVHDVRATVDAVSVARALRFDD